MDAAELAVDAIRRIPSRPDLFNHCESYEAARSEAALARKPVFAERFLTTWVEHRG